MGNYQKYRKRVLACALAAAVGFTNVPMPAHVLAAQQEQAARAEGPVLASDGSSIDIVKNGYKVEAEWCYDIWNVDKGDTFVEWSKKEWGNAKWAVYFAKAGKYKATLHMEVTEPSTGGFTQFQFGVLQDAEANPDKEIPGDGATDGYKDFVIDGIEVTESGKWTVKIMDSSKEVSAKLDYIQFELMEEYEEEPEVPEFTDEQIEAAKAVYMDKTRTTEERTEALLSVMTLKDKAAQMVQAEQGNGGGNKKGNRPATPELAKEYGLGSVLSGGGSAPPSGNSARDWQERVNAFKDAALESRLGIPLLYGVDAVHGHNNVDNAVIFPHNIGLGAANDEALVKKAARAAAEEIKATGIKWSFAPTIGIPGSERWGRFYECFGDDADIVTRLGAVYVEALQENGVAASAKHYIGEGQTKDGINQGDVITEPANEAAFDALMAEEKLLEPYKAAIEKGAYTVMASYNSVNGLKCHANKHLLSDVLKGDKASGGLGFEGFVVSDYNGTDQVEGSTYAEKVVNCVNAGVDMFMEPYDWENFIDAVTANTVTPAAIDAEAPEGKISIYRINDAVSRILKVKFDMGLFDENPVEAKREEQALLAGFGGEEHRKTAKEAAEKTLTVLKNDNVSVGGSKKAVLDLLDDGVFKNIVVAGDKANDIGAQCGGWTVTWQGGLDIDNKEGNISGPHKVTEGTTILEGFKAEAGADVKVQNSSRGNISEGADIAIVVAGENPYAESNGDKEASDLVLPDDDLAVIKNAVKSNKKDIPMVLVLMTGRPVAIADFIDDFDAVVEAWLPGTEGDAVASVMLDNTKDFYATCPVTWTWYPEYLTEKKDATKVLFPRGTGLKKEGTSINKDGQTSIPVNRPAAPEKPEEENIAKYKGGVDIDAYGGKLEGEHCNPSGSFNMWNVNIGEETVNGAKTGYVEWTAKEWGNAKWTVYIRQAGTYDISANINVTAPGNELELAIKKYDGADFDTPVAGKIAVNEVTGGYTIKDAGNVTFEEPGLYGVKLIDRTGSNWSFKGKLDYLKFLLKEASGEKDTGVYDPVAAADETSKKSEGKVIIKDGVEVYMTSTEGSANMSWYKNPFDMKNQVTEKAPLDITTVDNQDITTINVDPGKTYQEFLGLGTSLEEASVNNIIQLDEDVAQDMIESLVDPERGGMTLFRVTIGTSDFTAQNFYTYYDVEGNKLGEGNAIKNEDGTYSPDWYNTTGKGFSIENDRKYKIIDIIHKVQAAAKKYGVEDEVKFFASSWTPPGWMKGTTSFSTNHDDDYDKGMLLRGGTLLDEHIEDLAMYYIRFLEEYAKEGIDIYGMTLQNEPAGEFDYPSCLITGAQEGRLAIAIKKAIADSKILSEEQKKVKLWAFDHNPDLAIDYVKDIASVEGGIDALDGIAFHDYSGSMEIMQQVYDEYLNKGENKNQTVNLTERSVWGTTGANSIISYLRNNAISYNSWVTMLDSNIGVHQWPGTPDPTMFARAAGSSTDYWAMPEFYIAAQFSRFIRPGYVRVGSDAGIKDVANVVFKNPEDGSMVAVVSNNTDDKQDLKFVIDGQQFICGVPAKNVVTYVWPAKKTGGSNNGSNGGSSGGSSGGGAIPGNTTTPAPEGTAAPGNTPVPEGEGTPVPAPEGTPVPDSESTPVPAPGNTTEPGNTPAPGSNVPSKVTVKNSAYKVTSKDSTRTVEYTGIKKNAKEVTIPSSVKINGKEYKVTSIKANAFKGNKKIKKITIGKNIKKIGKGAFKNCKNLKKIVIKSKKLVSKNIGKNIFKGISKNAVIKVPKGKVKAYKKFIIKKGGAGKNIKVKAI